LSGQKIIFLADMESFYASVETACNPHLRGKPVAVCGDPALRHGIVLAASKEAKAWGVKTGQPAWECKRLCPAVVFVRPHMNRYIEYSLKISHIFEQFTDRVVPYSIDEQFMELTGCEKLWGGPRETAAAMIKRVWDETAIRCRIGLGENPLQAKMACDRFAKGSPAAFFELNHANYAEHTWPLPIENLFGVGHRMKRNFHRMGVRTIGHLAGLPREALALRWGINGELLWLNSHGIDYSALEPDSAAAQKGVGHTATLPRTTPKRRRSRWCCWRCPKRSASGPAPWAKWAPPSTSPAAAPILTAPPASPARNGCRSRRRQPLRSTPAHCGCSGRTGTAGRYARWG
jgi:DNA polymerase IV